MSKQIKIEQPKNQSNKLKYLVLFAAIITSIALAYSRCYEMIIKHIVNVPNYVPYVLAAIMTTVLFGVISCGLKDK